MTYKFTLESAQFQLEQLAEAYEGVDRFEIESNADVEAHKTATRIRELIRDNEDEIRENVYNLNS